MWRAESFVSPGALLPALFAGLSLFAAPHGLDYCFRLSGQVTLNRFTATSVLVIMLIIIVSAISCWFLFQVMKGAIRVEPKVLPCVRTVVPWMVKWAGCLLLHWGMCLSTSGSQYRSECSVLPHPQRSPGHVFLRIDTNLPALAK